MRTVVTLLASLLAACAELAAPIELVPVTEGDPGTIADAVNAANCGGDEQCLELTFLRVVTGSCKVTDDACLERLGMVCGDATNDTCFYTAVGQRDPETKLLDKVFLAQLIDRKANGSKVSASVVTSRRQ